jgi:hypothetical protein
MLFVIHLYYTQLSLHNPMARECNMCRKTKQAEQKSFSPAQRKRYNSSEQLHRDPLMPSTLPSHLTTDSGAAA